MLVRRFGVGIVLNMPSPLARWQANFELFRLTPARMTWPVNRFSPLHFPGKFVFHGFIPFSPRPGPKPSPDALQAGGLLLVTPRSQVLVKIWSKSLQANFKPGQAVSG